MERADRHVAKSKVGKVIISTVFLGTDHRFFSCESKVPLLFETMIFGGKHDQYTTRCGTWKQAEKMHTVALQLVKTDK